MQSQWFRRIVIASLAAALIAIALYQYAIWTAPPTLDLPMKGRYTSEIRPSYASAVCHYYRGFVADVTEQEAMQLLKAANWDCQEIQNNDETTIPTPYW